MNKVQAFFTDLISMLSFSPFITNITEEDIRRNLKLLKQHTWFLHYLEDDSYRQLIISDRDVRQTIGSLNPKRISSSPNRKVVRIIERKHSGSD
ncbi:hypothetical protein Bsel_0231 [[Bacillus] selenitireducens MLS10]|uniref:Uncharacterized protein n=1 Tax=Bacillus selenitireducens (strain ATCC 700615 / DSM 15326 / MLS10) TaxID=439292 RepID=D6XW03_BACIE|nr:hypothetical protein Bsel_0231 [[Bacillus] selenitireducens MLS10]